MLLGFIIYLPWGPGYPKLTSPGWCYKILTNLIALDNDLDYFLDLFCKLSDVLNHFVLCSFLRMFHNILYSFQVLTYQNGTKVVNEIITGNGGCPYDKSWCRDTPKLHFAQFLTAATLVGIGYPIAAVLLSTLYSKIIGPFPQVTK